MNYDALLSLIDHYGYFALFFALWLGIVGMPIPDEVIVLTGGAVTGSGLLQPVPAFLLTYLGVVSGLTLGYVLGRWIGTPIIDKLRRKKKMDMYFQRSENLISRYGDVTLAISYFFPVVRHIIPYIVGCNKMSYYRYALVSYSAGFVWTLAFFILGHLVGDHVEEVGNLVYRFGLRLLIVPLGLAVIFGALKYRKLVKARRGS